jgi:IS4 transposase
MLLRTQRALLLERLRATPAAAHQQHQARATIATTSATPAATHQQKQLAKPVARDPRFARLRDDDLAFFREVLGDAGVVTGEDALEPYNR